jgi:hypothetical protein
MGRQIALDPDLVGLGKSLAVRIRNDLKGRIQIRSYIYLLLGVVIFTDN